MARYLSGIRKQLQDVTDLFTARYGQESGIANLALKALVASALLEHELSILDGGSEEAEPSLEGVAVA